MPSFKCEKQPSFCMKSKVQFTHREGNTKAIRNVMYLGTCTPLTIVCRFATANARVGPCGPRQLRLLGADAGPELALAHRCAGGL